VKNRNNEEVPGGEIGDILQFGGGGGSARDLIKPGDDVKELLMRSNLVDDNEARDLSMSLSKMEEFKLKEEQKLLLYLLASKNSVRQQGRLQYLQGITGIIAMADNMWGMGRKKKKEKEVENA